MLQEGLVSIVTPVYNGAKWLHFLLDSVLEQTYEKIEMILVDDGSTDDTVETASTYSDAFKSRGYSFRIIRAAHSCAAGAMNHGFPYVRGEFLIWPDSDDRLMPESVAQRVQFLQQNRQYQAVRSLPFYFRGDTGETTKADERIGDPTKENLFFDVLESATFVSCGCYMFCTKAFFEIYPQRQIPVYPVGQNFQMLLPFLYHYPCRTISAYLYGVNVHEGSHSRQSLTRRQEEEKYAYYEQMIDELTQIAGIRAQEELRRISLWKLRRRYALASKYHDKRVQLDTYLKLWKEKDVGMGDLFTKVKRKMLRKFKRR